MNVTDLITKHEGTRDKPYCDRCGTTISRRAGGWFCKCHETDKFVGDLTIGVGHNLQVSGLSESAIRTQLNYDVNDLLVSLEKFAWFNALDPVRQAAIVDMAFTLGIDGLLGFDRMITMLKLGAWVEAANAILSSKWRTEAAMRAKEDAEIIRVGQWQF